MVNSAQEKARGGKGKLPCHIFWFRRDLRPHDNNGLYHALKSGGPVLGLFIFDTEILSKLKDKEDARVDYIHGALMRLKRQLRDLGSDLLVVHGTPLEAWKKVLADFEVKGLHYNGDYEPYALRRDRTIESLLSAAGISSHSYKDQCIFEKGEVLKKDGSPYTIYTPYQNRWMENLQPADHSYRPTKKYWAHFLPIKGNLPFPSLLELGFGPSSLRVEVPAISSELIRDYDKRRDLPGVQGTSRLGIHLRFGTISVRECVSAALELSSTWLKELIWREFFMQILYHFPRVEGGPFKERYKDISWINDKHHFKLWCEGRTGYPLVDAGMRELNQTGFMHNRVRMVTASFLVKHLLVDWRWGEKYFARKLLDFDLAANNGNWQWVAGTGCDSSPYYRVFNPTLQAQKFDPDHAYVDRWVPEWRGPLYPGPVVEHKVAVQRAKNAYKVGPEL